MLKTITCFRDIRISFMFCYPTSTGMRCFANMQFASMGFLEIDELQEFARKTELRPQISLTSTWEGGIKLQKYGTVCNTGIYLQLAFFKEKLQFKSLLSCDPWV